MIYKISIERRKNRDEKPYVETYEYEARTDADTVVSALSAINEGLEDKIAWDCSCLQKKCGACAMIINGKPGLACDAKLAKVGGKTGTISLCPLRKFPLVKDLLVDRSILFNNLLTIRNWAEEEAFASEKKNDVLYEASRCLQCGCCLEVCPNFYAGGTFFGMASAVPVSRLLEELPKDEQKRLRLDYSKHFYNGCGKSLACRDICPAQIDIEKLLVNSNAITLWKHLFKK
ncbi:MAG: succinate dehydrogenase [Lachnospiraceae bacterium]|nr:succinate dehydrogenase [Lachnospiraceae bacterium]